MAVHRLSIQVDPMVRVGSPAMARTGFAVVYDGPALADGEMPVRDLAPALLALGALFTEASTVLYPDLEQHQGD